MNKLAKVAGLFLLYFCFAFITPAGKKTIVIDAGHGGDDHGVAHNDLTEKELVHQIAEKIKSLNGGNNLDIILLREDDSYISLNDRVQKINSLKPDLLISLHINYSQDRHDHGISAFVSKSNIHYSSSLEQAENMITALSGGKLAKLEVKDANLYVLSHTTCPGLLLELGYMTNANDRNYLASEAGQAEIARKIVDCLQQ
ncbi:MAG TPA: N-acetylmuramoyl-L-alanine amidase [Flavobacteriales bacterium]|nr:N-acetylmuramoyl-L-alanine amidase [Flavobacteriales bacterium]